MPKWRRSARNVENWVDICHSQKGRNDECKKYRGITVMNIFSRVYGKIIKYYLEKSYKEKETEIQEGFRAGRSTIDHVFVIEQLIAKIVGSFGRHRN